MAFNTTADIIRSLIYPRLPACLVHRARLIGREWNQAYLDGVGVGGSLCAAQPANGGTLSIDFLVHNDELQAQASDGLNNQRSLPRMDERFHGRDPRIVATCSGVHLLTLSDPVQMCLWSPMVNQEVYIHPPDLADHDSHGPPGLCVEVTDGEGISPRYWIAIPTGRVTPLVLGNWDIRPPRFQVWDSGTEGWSVHQTANPFWLDQPRNAITIDTTIYYKISDGQIIFYKHREAPPHRVGTIVIPYQASSVHQPDWLMCEWKGSLGVLVHRVQDGKILVFTLEEGTLWNHLTTVDIVPIVSSNRLTFRSRAMGTRKIPGEEAFQALSSMRLIGFADPGWLLIWQRDGYVRISLSDLTARRLNIGNISWRFWSLRSSFIRLY
ncbi:uncharacterized protein LOC127764470 [Oryza glaberrima]|uniref:uncharacterized protein LOC127764470 n=1 Tax=Oryza glaberrima TaxID=4538 RepID=UPI00224C4823|nr:uncharacterized protein LOC127764470 [Oryza glaberrima]